LVGRFGYQRLCFFNSFAMAGSVFVSSFMKEFFSFSLFYLLLVLSLVLFQVQSLYVGISITNFHLWQKNKHLNIFSLLEV
jgi:hypothetical protein